MNQIKGNGFIITEENGNYTMSWMTGGLQDREVTYPVSKELVDKALRSEQDAYEVELFLQTGEWVTKESKEVARQNYFRSSPVRILVNPSSIKRLFSNQEFEELLQKAISSELKPTELDAIGIVDNHLELLLVDPVGWEEEIEAVHLEILQEKINNYIHFLESKQYVERYGDKFDKKVIHLTFQYSPSDNGLAFLAAVQKVLQPTDMSLKVELPDDDTLPEKKNLSVNVSHPNHDQEKVSQERYLQIKKEYKIRLGLVIFLFTIFAILSIVLIFNLSRFIPLAATAMGIVVPFNHFLLVPLWEQKKEIEKEHPEWRELSTSGIKIPSSESSKRTLAAIGTVLALFFSFAMLYRPVKVNTKIPTAEEIKNMPRFDNNYTPNSKSSSSSEPESRTTTSDLNETSSTEESTQSQTSSKEDQNYPYHIPGMSDEELKRVIDKTLKDFNEKREKEENSEKTESGNE